MHALHASRPTVGPERGGWGEMHAPGCITRQSRPPRASLSQKGRRRGTTRQSRPPHRFVVTDWTPRVHNTTRSQNPGEIDELCTPPPEPTPLIAAVKYPAERNPRHNPRVPLAPGEPRRRGGGRSARPASRA